METKPVFLRMAEWIEIHAFVIIELASICYAYMDASFFFVLSASFIATNVIRQVSARMYNRTYIRPLEKKIYNIKGEMSPVCLTGLIEWQS